MRSERMSGAAAPAPVWLGLDTIRGLHASLLAAVPPATSAYLLRPTSITPAHPWPIPGPPHRWSSLTLDQRTCRQWSGGCSPLKPATQPLEAAY